MYTCTCDVQRNGEVIELHGSSMHIFVFCFSDIISPEANTGDY